MANTVKIELDEATLKDLVMSYLSERMGNVDFKEEDVDIKVKSKQNYKSEWEEANFKASISVFI